MLKITNIKKKFYQEKTVLRDVNLTANAGMLTVIEGKNGAGKSTLFNILSGVISEDEGSVTLGDLNFLGLPAKTRASLIAVLRQDPAASTVFTMNILENCALALLKHRRAGLAHATGASVQKQALAHLANLGLDYASDLERPLASFSGGQRQMLAFAIATLHKPSLLLLDEPIAALDDDAAHVMMNLIKRFLHAWHIPALLISHNHELNNTYADTIYVLHDGIIV